MSILILIALSILSSIAFHLLIKLPYVVRAFLASITTAILLQLIAYFTDGYLEPLFMVAFIISWLVSFLIALVIGILFLVERRKPKKNG